MIGVKYEFDWEFCHLGLCWHAGLSIRYVHVEALGELRRKKVEYFLGGRLLPSWNRYLRIRSEEILLRRFPNPIKP